MRQPTTIPIAALFAILLSALPLHAQTVAARDVPDGGTELTTPDSLLTIRPSAPFRATDSYVGVQGGINNDAIDDADGIAPADEWLDLTFSDDAGLVGLDVTWTRALITLSGFTADPEASTGNYDPATGTWTTWQAWTGGGTVAFTFAQPAASAGSTLRLTALDPNQPGPQVSVVRLHYRNLTDWPPAIPLQADGSIRRQIIDHFGASMLWTIDPTEGWPEITKEQLALTLLSQAGGIGLSNLRFDFGGGNTDTGSATSEPWTWRFPVPLKDGPETDFDWSRREGQQWFLRRARDIGLDKFTLASISPPWWMTKNNKTYSAPSVGTTNLRSDKAEEYAEYLADVLSHFRDTEGITFAHVSPVNEPEWSWDSQSQEGNRATAADIRAMVIPLHAQLVERGLAENTRIFVADHAQINAALDDSYHRELNGDVWRGGNNSTYGKYREYIKDLYIHPDIRGKIDPVVAYHSYFTDSVSVLQGPLRSLLARNAEEHGLQVMQTEYCILGSAGPGRNLQMAPARHVFQVIHQDLTQARATAWNWWLALSPHDYKDGLVYTDFTSVGQQNPQLFESKLLWMLGNFSRFIRPGFQQIEAGGHHDLNGLMASTWQSPDQREIVVVAANFSDSPITVSLPGEAPDAGGQILEWEPWVTDRGRNLRREKPVARRFDLAPQSITTFVGRTSDSPFRLRISLSADRPLLLEGESVRLTARATYEDGIWLIPALAPDAEWIFQPVSAEPAGRLRAGRYFIRNRENHSFLTVVDSADLTADLDFASLKHSSHAWDVLPDEDGSLLLTHEKSGRILSPSPAGAVAQRAGGSAVPASSVKLDADFRWLDRGGVGPAIEVQPLVTTWYRVEATVGNNRASHRIRLRVGQAPATLTGLPKQVITRPGEPVTLHVSPQDPDRRWKFRIVPADRDEVVSAPNTQDLDMTLPRGSQSENWELVETGGSRTWPTLEPGRPCWIRSVSTRRYLSPKENRSDPGTPLGLAISPRASAVWVVEDTGSAQFRIRHAESGLLLNISRQTGKPILWTEEDSGNSRFYFDSLDEDPFELHWSHDLGTATIQTVSPSQTTTYTVHGVRGGLPISASTTVLVRKTFAQWSTDWFGSDAANPTADFNGSGASNLLEYGRGTDPLRPAGDFSWPTIKPRAGGFVFSWFKNPEALGTWELESSNNLTTWQTPPASNVVLEEDQETIEAHVLSNESECFFIRLRFSADQ